MTIGIYSLYWEKEDLIYIGLSSNIEDRFYAHMNSLNNGKHDNYKVQDAYIKFGSPKLIILEECSISDLNDKEIKWINEFDSINNGLNIIEGGGASYGVNHTTSKYSKSQILKVFSLLYRTNLSYKDISEKVSVSKVTVAAIAKGRVHTWLSKYGNKYDLALRNREDIARYNRANSRTGVGNKKYTYTFISPEGVTYTHICISSFCKEQGFPNISAAKQGFSRIINGHTDNYFNWKCLRHDVY